MKCLNCNNDTNNPKFCTVPCRNAYRRHYRYLNKCINCGCDTGNPKFCSSNCAAKYNNSHRVKKSKPCKNCGKLLIGYKATTKTYCDNNCQQEFFDKRRASSVIIGNISSSTAKKYVKENYNVCSLCGCGRIWNGLPLVLQVDHIDGNSDNNVLSNLRLICPNCHTQTETFCARNHKVHKNTKRNIGLRKFHNKNKRSVGSTATTVGLHPTNHGSIP